MMYEQDQIGHMDFVMTMCPSRMKSWVRLRSLAFLCTSIEAGTCHRKLASKFPFHTWHALRHATRASYWFL